METDLFKVRETLTAIHADIADWLASSHTGHLSVAYIGAVKREMAEIGSLRAFCVLGVVAGNNTDRLRYHHEWVDDEQTAARVLGEYKQFTPEIALVSYETWVGEFLEDWDCDIAPFPEDVSWPDTADEVSYLLTVPDGMVSDDLCEEAPSGVPKTPRGWHPVIVNDVYIDNASEIDRYYDTVAKGFAAQVDVEWQNTMHATTMRALQDHGAAPDWAVLYEDDDRGIRWSGAGSPDTLADVVAAIHDNPRQRPLATASWDGVLSYIADLSERGEL